MKVQAVDHGLGKVIEVLVYPRVFNADDYGFVTADTAGQAHPWGIVILSLPTLVVSFDHPWRLPTWASTSSHTCSILRAETSTACRSASSANGFEPGKACAGGRSDESTGPLGTGMTPNGVR
jgi:hypothetical protein